jgi:SAM-dependent methyltransferase
MLANTIAGDAPRGTLKPMAPSSDSELVEELLRRDPSVADCAVVACNRVSGAPRLAAFVVAASGPATQEMRRQFELDHVARYSEVYDSVYSEQQAFSGAVDGLSLRVWISSYTGQPIPEAEILEGVDDMRRRILSLSPRRVLEIGCGTGLLLFMIAPYCERYVATDSSRQGLAFLRRRLAARPPALPQVELLHRPAHDFSNLGCHQFDTVIINDVVIYFPTVYYLLDVLRQAAEVLAPGGVIFLGGLRSLPLQPLFHTSVVLHQAADRLPLSEVRRRIELRRAADKELVIDPRLFSLLCHTEPGFGSMRLELKEGRHYNEVTKFQYDVFLHSSAGERRPGGCRWLDWRQQPIGADELASLLAHDAPGAVAVRDVANARLTDDLQAAELLAGERGLETAGELREALRRASLPAALDPEALWRLRDRLPYDVGVGWTESAPDGRFQVSCVRRSTDARQRPWQEMPGQFTGPAVDVSQLANNPIEAAMNRRWAARLRDFAAASLSSDLVPAAFVVMRALPRLAGGGVDRAALEASAASSPTA